MGGPGPQHGAGAGIDRGAGSQHVVHQDDAAAGDAGPFAVRRTERALHIVRPLGLGQADLLRCARTRLRTSCSTGTPLISEIAPDNAAA